MYHFNLTYDVKNTLNKLQKIGLDKILHSDWLGLITVTEEGRILANNVNDYKNIDDLKILNLLSSKEIDIISFEKGTILSVEENGVNYNLILGVVCEYDSSKTVLISCSLNEKYNENDLIAFNLLKKVSYENVILNNEIVKERNCLQNIFDSTDLAFISINLQGEIIKVNKRIYNELGVREEIIGKSFYDYVNESQRRVLIKDINYVIFNNKRKTYKDITYENKTHEKLILDVTISPLIDGQNYVYGVVIVFTDLTKTRILEKELEQVKKTALLGNVSADIAHEIRNPLMGIRGCARILQKGIDKNSKQYKFIESIVTEVDRANETIERYLSYSRMNKEDTLTLIDLNEVLEKSSDLIFFYKGNKYINVEKKLSKNLPRIKGNVVRLQQAFINIFINSVQAIENEGSITISTNYIEDKEEVIVEISDNGSGIPKDNIKEIFDPYFTTKKDGTGLGLSITKKIVKKNGGEIFVSSNKNWGTKFKIIFQYKEMI